MASYGLRVNGDVHHVEADPAKPLLWVLRDQLGLLGTKYGCGVGVCGACVVLEGDRATRSCLVTMSQTAGKEYVTIEGLSVDGSHPCQRAWLDEDVAQCGYCQPGMIVEAAALLKRVASPEAEDVDAAFASHVCRCGTYDRLRRAVARAASLARGGS